MQPEYAASARVKCAQDRAKFLGRTQQKASLPSSAQVKARSGDLAIARLAKTSVPTLGERAACLQWLGGSHRPRLPEHSQTRKFPMFHVQSGAEPPSRSVAASTG